MKRKNNQATHPTSILLVKGIALSFPFHTPKPHPFYSFNRLYALKPKNPI
ncbi:hypothetical protein [Pedobacter miscanthi]|nr:hypothetical protein [Pedobacter miscanthi]